MSDIYSALAPERAGCNAKLGYQETEYLKTVLFSNGLAGDYSVSQVPAQTELISSIDKVGRFCADLSLFANAAICHAVRDVNSAMVAPIGIDCCFEFGGDMLTPSVREQLVSAVRASSARYGVKIGKCHSVFGGVTSLTVAAYGARPIRPACPVGSGAVILSSELGAYRTVYLSAQGHPLPDVHRAVELMTFDYSPIVTRLAPFVYDAADVSGFGLSGALASLASRSNVSIKLDLNSRVFLDGVRESISCLQSEGPPNVTGFTDEQMTILNRREVAGPLVMLAVGTVNEVLDLCRKQGLSPEVIGTFSDGGQSVRGA